MVSLRVLDPSHPGSQSLDSVSWLDVELTNGVREDHGPKAFPLPEILAISSKRGNNASTTLIRSAAQKLETAQIAGERLGALLIRFVFAKVSGHAVRPDFLTSRFNGAECVDSAVSFLDPRSKVCEVAEKQLASKNSLDDLVLLFDLAIGGITTAPRSDAAGIESLRSELDSEFLRRLSVPWILPQPSPQYRVFWVQGRADIESSVQFYEAAKSLGITLVVLDQPGHWMEDDNGPYAHYREAFLPVGVEGDEGLTQRVVDAVRSYPHKVDGIVTISDVRLPFVAHACEILGLPTSSSAGYFLAGNKGATRESENTDSETKEGFTVNSVAELDTFLGEQNSSISYPLIVKPCMGWNSDCVVKVKDRDELYTAVHRASERHAHGPNRTTQVVIEPYIDGPEVDANFVIVDGEILFCDISDDFPCLGDNSAGGIGMIAANFMETLMDVPSKLPQDEKEVLKQGLKRSISRLGFQSGVFHCEARVRDSRARYVEESDGIVDLHVPEKAESNKSPTCYLHEVNARPPGYINCVAALLAYGVDYYAIRLLLSLGPQENERVRILAQPFLDGKPQYILGIVVLPPTRAGTMASTDAVQDFIQANPALQSKIVHYQTLRKKGEYVEGPDSSELLAVGYIIVASRQGRREVLELSKQIRDSFDYKLEDDYV